MLIAFGGLPGTGKSTIAGQLAHRLQATYLRIDSIEQAMLCSGADPGPAGYMIAYRIAADNLNHDLSIVVDSVNPLKLTRDAYRDVAARAGAAFLEVEITCSDSAIHRQRIETRRSTVEGLKLPTWQEVEALHYEKWDRPHLTIDTASVSVADSLEQIMLALSSASPLPK